MKSEKRRCPCKSGKSIKDCKCGRFDKYGIPIRNPLSKEEIREIVARFRALPIEPFEKGGHLSGRRFIDTEFQGKRIRAIGNQIHKRPLNETFQQFLLEYLADRVGRDWLREEYAKSDENRHILANWFLQLETNVREVFARTEVKNFIPIEMTGNAKALLSIAYDFYSLKHCNAEVLPGLVKRLKVEDMFHGTRYEIAVAGVVARAGLDILWVNPKEKHCEFIAVDKNRHEYAIEAKSHGRSGVLGKKGQKFDLETAKIKVADHLREAMSQATPDRPLILFDDLNLPLTEDYSLEKKWLDAIDESLNKINYFEKYKNTHVGAIFVTNFPWHFEPNPKGHRNEVVAYFHMNGKYSIDPSLINLLKLSSEQYGDVPPRLEEQMDLEKPVNKS